ncbi:MAG TPA: hypothetical protein VGK94_11235 [Candidatus Polarisedimenticolia bacterium]|jgi:uncharacterized repeat protein (TIGR01451 family)
MRCWRRIAGTILLVAAVGVVGIRLGGAAPTLTTIAIDGDMADWATVLSNPENVINDGPGGGLIDADPGVPASLNLDKIAFTWDATYLYFYVHRLSSTGEFNYYYFHLDLNNDGLVANLAPLFRVGWWGSNQRTDTSLDTYQAVNVLAGDPITNGLGEHDGYKLPGNRVPGPALESLNGGSASGLEMEARVLWSSLGVAAGTALRWHLSTSRRLNDYPGQIKDNAGAGTAFAGVDLSPNRSVGAAPGGNLVLSHTVANLGNVADVFDLTWTSAGAYAPSSVTFYRDVDASGTLTPGDTLLVDTDGDGTVDTGSMAAGGAPRAVLAVAAIGSSPTLGQVCTLTLRARSSVTVSVTDTAIDTITIVQPSLTLVKAVDKATAPPGGVLTYTVTYSNAGSGDAISVVVVDPVPANTTYVTGSAAGAGMTITWSHDSGLSWDSSELAPVTNVRWQRAALLPAGGSGSVAFRVTVN